MAFFSCQEKDKSPEKMEKDEKTKDEESDSSEDPPEKTSEGPLTWPGPPPKTDRMDPRMQAESEILG